MRVLEQVGVQRQNKDKQPSTLLPAHPVTLHTVKSPCVFLAKIGSLCESLPSVSSVGLPTNHPQLTLTVPILSASQHGRSAAFWLLSAGWKYIMLLTSNGKPSQPSLHINKAANE